MCHPMIIPIVKSAATWLATAEGAAALAATGTAIAGTSAYKTKRRADKAEITAREQYDEQTKRQKEQDRIAKKQREEQERRQKEADDLAAAERERARKREEAAEAERLRLRTEQETRDRLTTEGRQSVTDAFAGTFTPDFYDKQRSAYTDLAEGELADKYDDAAKQLLFAMSRSGLGQSSARNLRQAKLTSAHKQAGEDIQDTASRQIAATKGQVAERKAALMGQAAGAQDPTYMGNMATNQAAALSKPQAYSGIGDPFAVALSGLTSAFASEQRKRAEEDYQRRMQQYGLTGSGASKVVS